MKIGIIGIILNPHSGARAPIDLAYYLRKRGHIVYFYAFSMNKDKETIKIFKKFGIKIQLVNKSKLPIIGFFINFLNLLTLLSRTRPQVVDTHIPLSLLLAPKFARIPIVLSYHGTQFDVLFERGLKKGFVVSVFNNILNFIIYAKSFVSVHLADFVVPISKYTNRELKRLYGRNDALTIYNGSSPAHFKSFRASRKATKETKLLTVSRITPYKQFEKIISVVNSIAPAHKLQLKIVGSAPVDNYLNYLKKSAKENTEILINISDTHLSKLYSECDIYLTADRYLFFGMPVLEAATFGKPSIAFNYAAAPELINDGVTGYVVDNETEFKERLRKLIIDRKLRIKMGTRAKINTRKFNWKISSKQYEDVFRKLIENNEK